MVNQPRNDSGDKERNTWKDNMKIQGQYDNTDKPNVGLLNDNKGVEHLWNISGAVAHAEEHHEIPRECRGLAIFS